MRRRTRSCLRLLWWLLLPGSPLLCQAEASPEPVASQPWHEIRSLHFHTYSCGPTQEVAQLTARLEQFRDAYALLAGTQAVASPAIVVMAFPDHSSLQRFLPLYQGKPANLAAFFSHGVDENLIALSLTETGHDTLATIYHEYAHLLFRRNETIWPMWLKEGMAEIYSTFTVAGAHTARLGLPIAAHLDRLEQEPLRPLAELFAVTRQSAGYNERQHQSIFYAESWLLTHYLMLGEPRSNQARFGRFTHLLQQGQAPETAFTNAFEIPLKVMQEQLRRYLERGDFRPLELAVKTDLRAPRAIATRRLGTAEVYFRLGDQLLRTGRLEEAGALFTKAQQLAPTNPLGLEGLGLLAAERHQSDQAIRHLQAALRLGSSSFLTFYIYAREKYRLTTSDLDRFSKVAEPSATEVRAALEKSIALMPDFGPAHHLLGFFELVQGDKPAAATQHLRRAIQLEPENLAYLLSLAQAELAGNHPDAARRTLENLCRPSTDRSLRRAAEEMLQTLGHR